MKATASNSSSAPRCALKTRAPSAANRLAMAVPIPLHPPLTKACFPLNIFYSSQLVSGTPSKSKFIVTPNPGLLGGITPPFSIGASKLQVSTVTMSRGSSTQRSIRSGTVAPIWKIEAADRTEPTVSCTEIVNPAARQRSRWRRA